jgi:hypothetical protein
LFRSSRSAWTIDHNNNCLYLLSEKRISNSMNLSTLIQDCIAAYTMDANENNSFPSSPPSSSASPLEMLSTAQEAQSQFDRFAEIPILSPEFSFKKTDELPSPLTPVSARGHALNAEFVCKHCQKEFRGRRQLHRHTQRHESPDRYSCPVENCQKTSHRIDAMRSHIKSHERRVQRQRLYTAQLEAKGN